MCSIYSILGVSGEIANATSKVVVSKLKSPPYRMPPQPPGLCGEVSIPGATIDPPLRTHSSKFPVSILFAVLLLQHLMCRSNYDSVIDYTFFYGVLAGPYKIYHHIIEIIWYKVCPTSFLNSVLNKFTDFRFDASMVVCVPSYTTRNFSGCALVLSWWDEAGKVTR